MSAGAKLIMKATKLLTILVAVVWMISGVHRAVAADAEGVALAIVYDNSGSMRQSVRDGKGKLSPKYVIASRALAAIVQQLQAFATNSATGSPRKIEAGLFVFKGNGARELVNFGPFDPQSVEGWTNNLPMPTTGTPLGNALTRAGQTVLKSKLARKHVLVITDGINTVGPDPSVTMPKLKEQAAQKQSAFSVHFVAFDVDAKVFDPVKKLGATVVGAADEKQLNTQLEFILQRKILLEEEEPPVKKK